MTPEWLENRVEEERRDLADALSAASEDTVGAVAGACALMAYAEGGDPNGVRSRLTGLIPSAGAAYDQAIQGVETGDAMAAARKAKGDVEEAGLVVRTACVVASETGDLLPAQAAVGRQLCEALNLSPTRFGF